MYINPQRRGSNKTLQLITAVIASGEAIREREWSQGTWALAIMFDFVLQEHVQEFVIKHTLNLFQETMKKGLKMKEKEKAS